MMIEELIVTYCQIIVFKLRLFLCRMSLSLAFVRWRGIVVRKS